MKPKKINYLVKIENIREIGRATKAIKKTTKAFEKLTEQIKKTDAAFTELKLSFPVFSECEVENDEQKPK